MKSKTGNFSPDQLASQLNQLDETVQQTRREDLGKLIDEMDNLAQLITTELKLDQEILEKEKDRFRRAFSLLDRVNPFNQERQAAKNTKVKPLKQEVNHDRALLTRCCELLEWVRNGSQPIEWKTNWHGGIFGVYNEHTGQSEWREAWHTGIAGVYHPDRQCVEWRERWKHGVSGVFNPVTREIEWKETWHGGNSGVFNPVAGEIEWRERWHHGVCGIFNPLTGQVEWKEVWNGGVAGAWCPHSKEVKWHEAWHEGVACLYYDGTAYRSSGSYYGDEDDD